LYLNGEKMKKNTATDPFKNFEYFGPSSKGTAATPKGKADPFNLFDYSCELKTPKA
jgi:hypothetical protein